MVGKKREPLAGPSVPVVYLLLTLEQGAERGLARDKLLRDTGISSAQLEDPSSYVPLFEYGRVVHRTLEWSGDRGLGYDFGLRANLSAQGIPGFGMMNSRTLREASSFGIQYFSKLRAPGFTVHCFVEGGEAIADVREAFPFGPLRQYALDVVLVTMTHIAQQFVDRSELSMWFDVPEPEYYARYREKLPPTKFSTGVNQLRCSAKHLERRLETASSVSKQVVVEQCERELALLGGPDPVSRVRAALGDTREGYPDLDWGRVAPRDVGPHAGSGTCARVASASANCSTKSAVATASAFSRRPTLTVEDVAHKLGYSEVGNFGRAFPGKWTGTSPAEFRKHGANHVPALHGR